MSPYIVTTRRPVDAVDCGHPEAPRDGWPTSRRAVATLDEARTIGREAIERSIGTKGWFGAPVHAQYEELDVSGGTITVPGGAVIEVERVGWPQLAARVENGAYLPEAEILAAFNAREVSS